MAGLIGIIRQSGIIKQAMGLAVSEFSGKKKAETNVPRTQRDLTMRTILTTLIAALATTFFFFQFGILGNWGQTAVALLIVFVISFLFTTVAANAIAIVGSKVGETNTLVTGPCGVCRQALYEFGGPELTVIMARSEDDYIVTTLGDLLPYGFGPANLE